MICRGLVVVIPRLLCITFGSIDDDIICYGPLLEFVDAVLELAQMWDGVNVSCNDGVVDIFPAEVCVSKGVIDR